MTGNLTANGKYESPNQRRPAAVPILSAGLFLLTFAVYAPSLSGSFVKLDDYQYVVDNPLVRGPSVGGVVRFFREVAHPSTVDGYYQPLTMAALAFDTWWTDGDAVHVSAFGFRLTNLLLHAAAGILLFLFLRQVIGDDWAAAAGALVFLLHPVQVESVAWVSQRKTVLATPLAIACLMAYVRWARQRRLCWWGVSLTCYVLANLAKPSVLLLPLTFVFLDYWPLHRRVGRRLIEKLPFFALAAGFGAIAWTSQSGSGARLAVADLSAGLAIARWIALLCYNVMLYAGNLVWPADLSPFRSLPTDLSWTAPPILAGFAVTIGIAAVWLASRRRRPSLFVGIGAAGIMLLPALGPVRFMASVVADRFLYLPLALLMLPLADVVSQLARGDSFRRRVVGALVLAPMIPLVMLTLAHQRVWGDSMALWTHVARAAPDLAQAHSSLSRELIDAGRFDAAHESASRALELAPADPHYMIDLARAAARTGRSAEAVRLCDLALAKDLGGFEAGGRIALAEARLAGADLAAARSACQAAMDAGMQPVLAYQRLGDFAYRTLNRPDAAIAFYADAVRADPRNVVVRWNLGTVLFHVGRYDEALAAYRRTAELYREGGHELPPPLRRAMEDLRRRIEANRPPSSAPAGDP